MKLRVAIFAAVIVAICGATLRAQPAAAQMAATKVAVIDTEAFSDKKVGIKRLVAALERVDLDLKPRRDELQGMRVKYDALIKSINDTEKIADPNVIRAKRDEVESLQREMKWKQEDGQKALDKRVTELTGPIYQEIGTALQAYAKQRGIDIVLDASKLPNILMLVNQATDITDAFIGEYNTKNPVVPASVPVKTP